MFGRDACSPAIQGDQSMKHQIPLPEEAMAPDLHDGLVHEIAPGVAYMRLGISNCVLVGFPDTGEEGWVLVDAGVSGFAGRIERAARERFGADESYPTGVVLTHGHFDHVGSLGRLLRTWDVPVFAHRQEMPFLDGRRAYPRPDPWAGGMMSLTSPMLPRGPFDLRPHLRELPGNGSVPGMPGWEWIHTPGHSEGHVSLWRERDGTLVVGDAFITTRQESAYDVITQRAEMHGPPMYFTPDWDAARESVRLLASLEPELVVTGHGRAMRGPAMRRALYRLAEEFDRVARPER
jgi:glyoxylase-like metal-dependent hydrolase (beta-lactamase superfamily II)